MLSKLKLIDTIDHIYYTVKCYELDGISIEFSFSDKFSVIENVDNGRKNVLTLSLSNHNKTIPGEVIRFCLMHFGFDARKEIYFKCVPYTDYVLGKKVNVIYYEQLSEKK